MLNQDFNQAQNRRKGRPHRLPVSVLKFGGSVLESLNGLEAAVQEIYSELRRGRRVVAVVSALSGVTDHLLHAASSRYPDPDPAALAALLATGEAASAAYLALALEHAGVSTSVLDPVGAGLEVRGPALDADPVDLDAEAVQRILEQRSVAVLPGFYGRDRAGSPALLGRGGSDLTALFVAHRLGAAECRLLKDVDGLYTSDPRSSRGAPRRFASLTWETAAAVAGKSIQTKSLGFARRHEIPFSVGSPLSPSRSEIGPGPDRLAEPAANGRPLRVLLLGLGTVGLGVFRRLRGQGRLFDLAGIAVREPGKKRSEEIAPGLLVRDPNRLLDRGTDVVVELIGGDEPAASLISQSLERGFHVVTANKSVLAVQGERLIGIARSRGVHLKYSAAVGGAVPVLECVEQIARACRIERIQAVLNGTCNFILDQIAEGRSFSASLRRAQELGFAERDPSLDLDGIDSAQKLAIACGAAFGQRPQAGSIECEGIDGGIESRVRYETSRNRVIRLVADARRNGNRIRARASVRALEADHFLAGARGAENRVVLDLEGGQEALLSGKGAGKEPTSLAVLADLLDLHREFAGIAGSRVPD